MTGSRKRLVIGLGAALAVSVLLFAAYAVLGPFPHAPTYGNRIGGPEPAAPPGASYSFALMGDTRSNWPVLESCVKGAASSRAAFAIFNGDLVESASAAEFDRFNSVVTQAAAGKFPVYLVVGNHDRSLGPIHHHITLYRNFFGPEEYTFACGPDRFVVLDDSAETCAADQAAALEKRLADERPRARNLFIVCHTPPVDPRPDRDETPHCLPPEDGRRLLDLAAKYRVAAILASHIHGYADHRAGGVRVIISGGAGAKLAKGYEFHWALVTVTGSEIKAEPHLVHAAE